MTTPTLRFLALSGVHEPSAIQQLPDGRFLVVEDEKNHPFSLVAFQPDGTSSSTPLATTTKADGNAMKLDDLEGLATDAAGWVYAITSHSRNGDGEEKKSREKLLRFRVEGERVAAPVVVKSLKAALIEAHPALAEAAAVLDVKAAAGLNVEALEMTPDRQRLLVGLRSPLLDGHAIVVGIDNPAALFETGAAPRISPPITLDLGGHGLRGMSYIPALGGYLLIGGPVSKEQVQFQLWFWSGQPQDAPRRAELPGLPGFAHAEGVSPAVIDGRERIVIVSDDGDRAAGRPAGFLLLDPAQLRIAPNSEH